MTTAEVKSLHQAKPFRPFTIHLADGEKLPVKSPEFMWITPGGRTIIVGHDDGEMSIIDLLLVTQITTGNGRTARRKV
ncbi:MAG: hypothetical protein WD851_25500 [Pirellulales bacterium]